MEIWGAAVLLIAPAILAATTVILARIALKGTPPQDRAAILRALTHLVHELRRRR
jgi:hypothetical protein